ncbi:hypothetical protein ACVWXM_000436 [Bradyrhizobium sp. GM7.3]
MVPPPSDFILGTTRTLWHVIGPLQIVLGAMEASYGVTFFLRFVGTGGRQRRLKGGVCRFLGLAQLSKPRHVLANIDGLLSNVHHRPRAFLSGQTLTVRTRDAFG